MFTLSRDYGLITDTSKQEPIASSYFKDLVLKFTLTGFVLSGRTLIFVEVPHFGILYSTFMRFSKSPEVCLLEDVPKLSISSSVCLSIMLAI
jgi:hypothetical protein